MAFCTEFFGWYNHEHYHSGIALLTPSSVHHGTAAEIVAQRQVTLTAAHAAHPERFVNGLPKPKPVPLVTWINPPQPTAADTTQPIENPL